MRYRVDDVHNGVEFKRMEVLLEDRPKPGAAGKIAAELVPAKNGRATPRAVVLMYDGGERGYCAMRKAAGKLIAGTLIKVVKLADGAQPDDLCGDELACLLPS